MTFNQFLAAVAAIGIPLYFLLGTRRDEWNWVTILLVFCVGIWILLVSALVSWVFDDLMYFPSWLLFQETGRNGFRWIPISYGFFGASILLALRQLANRTADEN